jgi:hypothetical protein
LLSYLPAAKKTTIDNAAIQIDGISQVEGTTTDKIDLNKNLIAYYPFNGTN